MNKLVVISAALTISFCTVGQTNYKAFVLNTRSDSATVFNPLTGEIFNKISTGKHPQDVRLSKDGKQAFVLNMGSNSIGIYNVADYSLKAEIQLGEWKNPHWSVLSRDGKVLWFACGQQRTILEVDIRKRSIVRRWDTQQPGPYNFTISRDDEKIYTANFDTTTVSVINRKTGTVTFIDIGKQPIGADTSPDGNEVWISSMGSDLISIINPQSDQVLTAFPSGSKGAVRLKFTHGGTNVLVVHNSGVLTVFDTKQRKLLWTLSLPKQFPKSIAISSDDKFAVISLLGGKDVVTVDLEKQAVVRTTRTGSAPEGIVFIE